MNSVQAFVQIEGLGFFHLYAEHLYITTACLCTPINPGRAACVISMPQKVLGKVFSILTPQVGGWLNVACPSVMLLHKLFSESLPNCTCICTCSETLLAVLSLVNKYVTSCEQSLIRLKKPLKNGWGMRASTKSCRRVEILKMIRSPNDFFH